MLYPDLVDVPIDVFGGYCPAIPPDNLPEGAASIAQDVEFPQAAVRQRGGLRSVLGGGPIPANASINGLKTYLTPSTNQRLMVWDSLGNLFKENPEGTLNLINSRPYQNLFYRSETIFGREYQAFFDRNGGFDIPRQYDDTNWDRVSQSGPGAAPIAGDEVDSYNIVASPGGLSMSAAPITILTITETDNIVTVTLTGSANLADVGPGDTLVVAGVPVTAYNGTWTCLTVQFVGTHYVYTYAANLLGLGASVGGTLAATTAWVTTTRINLFTVGQSVTIAGAGVAGYNGSWTVTRSGNFTIAVRLNVSGLAASGNGTIVPTGNIVAGTHQVTVCFITRQGYITPPAVPPFTWIAAGSKRVIVGKLPIGPQNVVARLLLFTPVITAPATTGSFYSLPTGSSQISGSTMLIPDNASTSATVDFTDTILIAGFAANYLFTQLELGESAFPIGYNSRMVWLGERNKLNNLINLSFDGGFDQTSTFPLGWTLDPVFGAGGNSAQALNLPSDWGDAYVITGDGVTAIRGKITQSAFQDYLQVPIIARNTAYGVRARVAKAGGLAAGTLHINLFSVSGTLGPPTLGLQVTAAQAGASFAEFTAPLTNNPLANPPADMLLQLYADGTPTNNGQFIVDSIEVYPLDTPFNYSTARISHAFNPESYDGTLGQIQVRPGDGQQLRSGFPLRNNLYLAKDHYLCYVADDGVNEPASWSVNEVSSTIGICGPNAVDSCEEWAVFAERSGLYICWGSDPVKLTPEIQNDASGTGKVSWASINWLYGHTLWVRIDKTNKMIFVGAPIGTATTPNVVFMLDYRWLTTAEEIASAPLVTYSSYSGKMIGHGKGRRWAIWNITANSMTFAERANGTAQPFFGNGKANGKIYQQVDAASQASDDGEDIASTYQTYGCPSAVEEQVMQLGAHRKLCGYLKFRAIGAGLLHLAISTARRTTLLRNYQLSTMPAGDGERPVDAHGERFFFTVSSNTAGTWWQLEKLIPCLRKDATIPVRGVSA